MKYKIEKLDHYGRGIIRNEKLIFVENALPGELVEIKILNEKKKFIEAVATKIENENIDRCIPNCKYYNECGGCNLLHMKYENNLKFKQNKIKEIMNKFLKENVKINDIIHTENIENYRNKATFHVDKKIGYYKKNSNEIIEVDKCNIVDESINEILNLLKNISLKNIYEIIIRKSKYTNDSMVIVKLNGSIDEKLIIETLKNDVTSIIIYQNRRFIH